MLKIIAGSFVILHGLVHLWLVTLSLRLIEFKPEMGWTGESWMLSNFVRSSTLRNIASAGFILATLLLLVGGVGIISQAAWSWTALLIAAVFSSVFLLLFWDGSFELIVQKGLIGLVINVVIIIIALPQK